MTGQDIYMLTKAARELVETRAQLSTSSSYDIRYKAASAAENLLEIIAKYRPEK